VASPLPILYKRREGKERKGKEMKGKERKGIGIGDVAS
jgi:hypothetical protein